MHPSQPGEPNSEQTSELLSDHQRVNEIKAPIRAARAEEFRPLSAIGGSSGTINPRRCRFSPITEAALTNQPLRRLTSALMDFKRITIANAGGHAFEYWDNLDTETQPKLISQEVIDYLKPVIGPF